MTIPLFLDSKPRFEKIAMPVRLSESPEAWQRDIAGEVYKQLPFLGDYAVNVILDRVDQQRGFGFGSIHVTNKSDSPLPDQAELPSIRIPVVIRDYLMAPLDIFMDGSGVYPLSESRVREKLFRADTFELSTRKPSDKGIVDQLYPPFRTNYGLGSVGSDTMGIGKYASRGSLLDAIAPTISERMADEFVSQVTSDPEIKTAALSNEVFSKLAMKIAGAPHMGVEKTASVLVESIKPTVVQFQKLASGSFLVKWANAQAFAPQQDVVPPGAANQMAGTDLSSMQPGATLTASTEKATKQSLDEETYVKVEQFGKYFVQDMDSNAEYCGWVIPIVDMEMHPLELYVFLDPGQDAGFSGGSDEPTVQTSPAQPGAWAVQDEIAGSIGDTKLEEWASLCESGQPPQGSGMFVSSTGRCCLLPMTVQSMSQGPDGTPTLVAETMFGEPITLQMVPGLQAVEQMGEGMYGIPQELAWVPLNGDPVFLAKNPLDIENTQQAQQAPQQVSVGSTGPGEFSMDGQPLAKVAKDQKTFLKTAEAEFLLAAMGVSNPWHVLAEAEKGLKVKVACQPIVPLAYVHADMIKKAHAELGEFPYHLRQNLVKEASVIDDADTADKVLAMNFINPENISAFASYLPELDQASKKLAELLLAIRLGMGSVDEGAVERAMKGLEVVVDGLKLLQQKVAD